MAYSKKGGVQQPDGKQRTSGPGSLSKRNDMQAVRTPAMHGSDLQYGDKQMLAGAQKIQPLGRQQNPAASATRPATSAGTPPGAGGGGGIPGAPTDPMAFLTRRLQGSMSQTPTQHGAMGTPAFKGARWMPMLRALASDPGSGGLLQSAYINALATAVNSPTAPMTELVDYGALEDGVILEDA